MSIDVSVINNADLVRNALPEQIEAALLAVGMTAETYAKGECPVDTGRLRNSVTFALSGKSANAATYSDNKGNTYGYSGTAPTEGKNRSAVYIGTNVEYGIMVEMGTAKMKARPFLRLAATTHSDEYQSLVKQALSG